MLNWVLSLGALALACHCPRGCIPGYHYRMPLINHDITCDCPTTSTFDTVASSPWNYGSLLLDQCRMIKETLKGFKNGPTSIGEMIGHREWFSVKLDAETSTLDMVVTCPPNCAVFLSDRCRMAGNYQFWSRSGTPLLEGTIPLTI